MDNDKIWNITDTSKGHEAELKRICDELHVLPLTARLLFNRGYRTPEEAQRFIRVETELFHNPFLLRDMDRAVLRLQRAIHNRERIVIYGDYDVDGVTSVSLLYLYLRRRGADVGFYIPNRIGEGYGVNREALDRLASEGCRLLVTVDTGITASAEIAYAYQLGMEVVVTDHHACHEELPNAEAVVNPQRSDCTYPFKPLAGVGVAFKLACALEAAERKTIGDHGDFMREMCMEYIDLVAMGTVADVMPLVGENRLIVSMGLVRIAETKRPGLAALLEQTAGSGSKKRVTSSLIGFTLAPRINAAGRISDASLAVKLFLTDSVTEGEQLAAELCEINRQRQNEENCMMEQAADKIISLPDLGSNPVIVLHDDHWHHGVVGIVASRITEHYGYPSILISFDGDIGKGSGRSVHGLNLVEALQSCSDLLIKFGGHELAAGLTIERKNLAAFCERINAYARQRLKPEMLTARLDADCETEASELTLRQAHELYLLEPYGVSNPVPQFVLRDAEIVEIMPIGSNRHTRMTLRKNGRLLSAVCFGTVAEELDFVAGDRADVVFNLTVNEFRGSETAQLIVRDINHPGAFYLGLTAGQEQYRKITAGTEPIPSAWHAVPTRADFVSLYLCLRREVQSGHGAMTLHCLQARLQGQKMTYPRLRLALDILSETGLLSAENALSSNGNSADRRAERYVFRIHEQEHKVDLEQSSLYRHIRQRAGEN